MGTNAPATRLADRYRDVQFGVARHPFGHHNPVKLGSGGMREGEVRGGDRLILAAACTESSGSRGKRVCVGQLTPNCSRAPKRALKVRGAQAAVADALLSCGTYREHVAQTFG